MKEAKKCWECGEKIVHKKVDFSLYGVSLGKFDAEVCLKCGEEVFTEEVSKQIDNAAKESGLWGLEAHTKVGRTGDSLMIRVNKNLVKFLDLKEGEEITLYPQNKKKLIVEI